MLQAEVELANAKTTRIHAQANVDIAYQALRTVLSLPDLQPLTLEGTLEQIERLPEQGELLPSALAARTSRVHRARTIAEHSVALASGEMKPSLAFTGNLQYQEDAFNTLVDASTTATRSASPSACRSWPRRRPRRGR